MYVCTYCIVQVIVTWAVADLAYRALSHGTYSHFQSIPLKKTFEDTTKYEAY